MTKSLVIFALGDRYRLKNLVKTGGNVLYDGIKGKIFD